MPVCHCDPVEGTTLGQGGFHGPGSSSKGLFSSNVEGSALPGKAVEMVPAKAVLSPGGCSTTDQQDTCQNAGGCRALDGKHLMGRMEELTECICSHTAAHPSPVISVFIIPSHCVMSIWAVSFPGMALAIFNCQAQGTPKPPYK